MSGRRLARYGLTCALFVEGTMASGCSDNKRLESPKEFKAMPTEPPRGGLGGPMRRGPGGTQPEGRGGGKVGTAGAID